MPVEGCPTSRYDSTGERLQLRQLREASRHLKRARTGANQSKSKQHATFSSKQNQGELCAAPRHRSLPHCHRPFLLLAPQHMLVCSGWTSAGTMAETWDSPTGTTIRAPRRQIRIQTICVLTRRYGYGYSHTGSAGFEHSRSAGCQSAAPGDSQLF